MSRRPTQFPTTLADCHKLILDLDAELAQRELHAARLRDEVAARGKRSVASTGVSGAGGSAPSPSFQAVFAVDADRHNAS